MNSAHERERVVVSVGGSLIVPDRVNIDFLKRLQKLVLDHVERGYSFVIISGGGRTARDYQEAAKEISTPSESDLDWLGIHATRINAHLLRTIFADVAHPHIIKNPNGDIETDKPVLIASGWHPGASTDYVAVLLAKNLAAHKLVNLTNIDYVYEEDPSKNPEAKKIERASWANFRKLIPEEWDPGLNSPFDPVAAKEAETIGLEVAIINGTHLERFSEYLANEHFFGTIIS